MGTVWRVVAKLPRASRVPFSVKSMLTESKMKERVCSSTPGSIALASPRAFSCANKPPSARLRNNCAHTSARQTVACGGQSSRAGASAGLTKRTRRRR